MSNTETTDSNRKLLQALHGSLATDEAKEKIKKDFSKTFTSLGVPHDASEGLAISVLAYIMAAKTLEQAEQTVRVLFEECHYDSKTVFAMIQDGLQQRFEIIYDQIEPFMKNAGFTLDYGCGSGILTQMLNDRLSLDIEGCDVRDFKHDSVTVTVKRMNGCSVHVPDKYYDCAVLTNVIHHEAENEKILQELDRIVSDKLVIIETVPEGATEEDAKKDWGRMLLNDALWNRFFNYADIPVPGTYETPDNWIRRFAKYGWRCTRTKDLGFDQPTIQDRHHLLVFER